MPIFKIIPDQASNFAAQIDYLIWVLTALTVFFTVLVVGLVVYFSVRYRKGSKAYRAVEHPDNKTAEYAWSILPIFPSIAVFVWASWLFGIYSQAPEGAMEINVVGKQWMWHIQHPNGRREINELHVPTGRPVKLTMTSQDVLHSFFLPSLRTKMDVLPGRYTQQWFEATKPGKYRLFCAEYCGTEHSRMGGYLYIMAPGEYEKWLMTGNAGESGPPETQGQKLFTKLGCVTCHMSGDPTRAPELKGIYGGHVQLQSGEKIEMNEDYIQESILVPSAKVVSGFSPIMPTYKNQVSQQDIQNLIAYIKSLSTKQ
jgi:cytochrome c oxidase subunit 2